MSTLWKKRGHSVDPEIAAYCTGTDPYWDSYLAWTDVYGSLAHAQMLTTIGILQKSEYAKIKTALKFILKQIESGKFVIAAADEDVHTALENALTKKLGGIGKKIHTARSRNDQSTTNIRLFSKDELHKTAAAVNTCALSLLAFAKKHEWQPMPGYTHFRKAMPSSVGMWASSFANLLLDDMKLLECAYALNDQSPLGAAASYGVPLPIDRKLTASLLGFSRVQENSLACINSRGKIAATIIHALGQVMGTLSRLATDLILFTSEAQPFFILDPSVCTGSSIMPQKRNPDPLELIRGKTHAVLSHYSHVVHLEPAIPSGYNRDLQGVKQPVIESFEITQSSCSVMTKIIGSLKVNKMALEVAVTAELFATEKAYDLVHTGIPFRDAYGQVASRLDELQVPKNLKASLKKSNHIGGTGQLRLGTLMSEHVRQDNRWQQKEKLFWQTLHKLTR